METSVLNTNSLAFIALCNEYCAAIEHVQQSDRDSFVKSMLRLLPRLYISANDLDVQVVDEDEAYLESSLEEDYYESVRRGIENIMGPDDVYLEVFGSHSHCTDFRQLLQASRRAWPIYSKCYIILSTW